MAPLSSSPFSYHFTVLRFLGSWILETENSFEMIVFAIYRLVVTLLGLCGVVGLVLNLYMVMGDMKKMTWNLCVTVLLVRTMIKNFQMLQKNQTINKLRLLLHQDAESRDSPEDVFIHNLALKELKLLRMFFYGTSITFIPTWVITRYSGFFWGCKKLPIPFHVPSVFDMDNDVQFHVAYVLLTFASIFEMMLIMETELAMYGLLVQISREYKVLVKDIPEINKMYEDDDDEISFQSSQISYVRGEKEVNPRLKKLKTNTLVKKFSARQKELIEYTNAFESCFNKPLFQEFLGMSILIITLALQCLWESVDFSGYLIYQMGYLFINILDMFLICLFSTKLQTQCLQVGLTAYSTLWYRMEVTVQKDIMMIIMRSQHPPKITVGKYMELSLNAFMNTMMNLYSWLALFRQLELSTSV